MIYVFHLFLILPLGFYAPQQRNLISFFVFSLFLYIVFFHGTYFEVGGDWLTYQRIYKYPNSADMDPIYSFIITINKLFLSTNIGVNSIIALIFVLALFNLADHPRDLFVILSWNLSYLLPIVVMGYNRQALAIGFLYIFLSLIKNLKKSKNFKKLVSGVAILGSHSSGGFALVLLAITQSKLMLIPLLLLGFFFLDKLIDTIIVYSMYGSESKGFYMRSAANFFVILIAWMIIPRTPKYRLLCVLLLSVILVWWVISFVIPTSVLFDRLNIYITAIITLLLSNSSKTLRELSAKKWCLFASLIWVISLILISLWVTFADHKSYWLPYKNIITEAL